MNNWLKKAKQNIRPYLQQISNESLWQLAAMSKDFQLEYTNPCKCIRGVVGGGTNIGYASEHSREALIAEMGFEELWLHPNHGPRDQKTKNYQRNVRLLPMIRYEIRRRERLAKQNEVTEIVEQEVNA